MPLKWPSLPKRSGRKSSTFWIAVGIIAAMAITPAILSRNYTTDMLTNIGFYVSLSIIYAILALGFNLQWGYTGLFNAGIAGFFLIGAYTAAFAITPPSPPISIAGVIVYPGHVGGYSLPFAVGAILAMVASGSVAALVALPALRLRADYLAIATLAFAEIVQIFTANLQSLTGGTIGVILIPKPVAIQPPNAFLSTMTIIAIGAAILIALLVLLQFMGESPWGRVLRAVREDEEATMALGKNSSWYKLQAFALGGALMGLAGALFAVTLVYLEPQTSFAPTVTFSIWVMVIVGGSGNNRGVILGAFIIYGLEWLSNQLKDYVPNLVTIGAVSFNPQDTIFYTRFMLVGVLLIVLIIYRPEGILRETKRVLT